MDHLVVVAGPDYWVLSANVFLAFLGLLLFGWLAVVAWRKGRRAHFWIPAIGVPIAGLTLVSAATSGEGLENLGTVVVGFLIGAATLLAWLVALIVAVVRRPKVGSAVARAERRRAFSTCRRCGAYNAWDLHCENCMAWLEGAPGVDHNESV